MKFSSRLYREMTNVPLRTSTTFNAPGTYYPPYGKTVFTIAGRGTPGNASVPGNQVSNPPYSNSPYNNPPTSNPPTANNPSTNPPTMNAPVQNAPSTNPATSNPPTTNPPSQDFVFVSIRSNCPPGYFLIDGGDSGSGGTQTKECQGTIPGNVVPGNVVPGNVVPGNTTPGNTVPGNLVPGNVTPGNTVPGNLVPGNWVPGNSYSNPSTPGNAGAPSSVLGVPFPGGGANASAPIVGEVSLALGFSKTGIAVAVPPRGYVVIKNK